MYNLGLKGGILCGKSKCIKIFSLYLILFPNLNAIDLNVRVSKNQLTDTETSELNILIISYFFLLNINLVLYYIIYYINRRK